MSSIAQQDDAADSGKDEENNTATTSITANLDISSGDTTSAKHDVNPNVTENVKQRLSTIDAIGGIQEVKSVKPLSVEKSEDNTRSEINEGSENSELIKSSIPLGEIFDSDNLRKDNTETDMAARKLLDDITPVTNITDSQVNSKTVVPKSVLETGFSETVIDASDTEFKLRWSDDENDDENDGVALSDEALKILDIELDSAYTEISKNNKENTVKEVIESSSAQNHSQIEKPKEFVDEGNSRVATFKKPNEVENLQMSHGNNSETVRERLDESNIVLNLDKIADVYDDVKVGKKGNKNDTDIKQINQDNDQILHSITELVEVSTKSCNTEHLDNAADVCGIEKTANADMILGSNELSFSKDSVETEFDQSLHKEKLTDLENEIGVDEANKISEIDIDETIVDLKHLIDQDEDTIKQLGLDIGESNYKNELISILVEEKTKINNEASASVKNISESAKSNTVMTNSNKGKNEQPMDKGIPTGLADPTFATIAKVSLDTNPGENPTIQQSSITKPTSVFEGKDDGKINDQKINDVLESVSDINKIDIGNESLISNETNIIESDNPLIPLDQVNFQIDNVDEIASEKNVNRRTEEKKEQTTDNNDKTDNILIKEISKNDIPSDNNKEAPCYQKLVENSDIVNNERSIKNNGGNTSDDSKILKISNESNLDNFIKDTLIPNAKESITPDVTNDSIKINTEHRVNRPDVMLDIPTQEFSFDEFDDSLEIQEKLDKTNKNDSDLTTKTVTEIVHQLTKEMDVDTNEIKDVSNIEITHNEQQSDTRNDTDITSIEKNDYTTDRLEDDVNMTNISVKPEESQKQDTILEKDLKATENIEKSVGDIQSSSSSTEARIDVQNKNVVTQVDKSPELESLSKENTQKLKDTSHNTIFNDMESKLTGEAQNNRIFPVSCLSTSENVVSKSSEKSLKPEDFDHQLSTSGSMKPKLTESVQIPEHDDPQPSTSGNMESKSTEKVQIPEDPQPSTAESMESNMIDITQKPEDIYPSTSEGVTEETQEVTDSLDLLAESSRVMDDDDDDEEQEPEEEDPDDGDEGDDFDPDDEENSNPTGEHSEESNPPHSEVDIQEDAIDIEFNNEADKIGLDSNDATFDSLLGDSADITVEKCETTIQPMSTEAVEKEKEQQEETASNSGESEGKSSESTSDVTTRPKKRRSSILVELLTKPAAGMNIAKKDDAKKTDNFKKNDTSKSVNDIGVVDLGGSSSDDDVQDNKVKKDEASLFCSVLQKSLLDDKNKIVTGDGDSKEKGDKMKSGEVFSLDSDDDDKMGNEVSFIGAPRENNKCINYGCTSDENVAYYLADRMTIAYYGAARRRKRAVCQNCLDVVNARNEGLVAGIKDFRPLMSLRMARPTQTLLEISDSDSEGEDEPVGEEGARFLEDQLTDVLNGMWSKYNLDNRLKATEDYLQTELEKMQKQSEEVDKLLRDCQKATDDLRTQFYSSFEGPRQELPGISIHDTPIASYACFETEEEVEEVSKYPMRYPKRRSTTTVEIPAKKQALNYEDRKVTRSMVEGQGKPEEDKDISVVRLSAEVAPADLPPPGDLVRPTVKVGAQVYAMKNQYGAWLKGKVLEVQPKTNEAHYTVCRVRFDHKSTCKSLSARSIAYTEPCEARMTIGTRVIALFKNSENSNKRGEFYYSGVIAEVPNPVNRYRYLIFFDDGYAQYVEHKHTRLVYESKTLVWEEVHPFSRDFVCNYLMKYPERAMVRLHPGHQLSVEWNGKWWDTKVIEVDAALVHIQFPDNRTEWIYRGSTRLKPLFAELLAAKRGDRARLPRSTKANTKTNVPYVEYTRSDDQAKAEAQSAEDLRRQRSVAKKSTTIAQQISSAATDGVISRVVFYTPKNSVRPLKMVSHVCGLQCKRSDLISLKDLRTYNPLTKPLLSGWERQIVRHKSSRSVMYRAPCGRRLRCMSELHQYLRVIRSEMPVDLFDFNPNTHCLAEFVLNKTNVQKKDLSHGKENVPVPCVNYYDHSLPEFCSYNTVRTPTAGVPLNLDTDFLCGCDCEDDCKDKKKCACWKMTLEGARTIGMEGRDIGYNYRRLPEPLPSGIYECNSRCKCKSTCLNRVVQNPLQLKLQVFKTLNRGWGIRALNDVPKGAFICIYAGNLLTDATANLDGLNEGDEYLAELDYIEVVEAMKEGYEDDVPEADKELDKKDSKKSESESETESTESEAEDTKNKTEEDGDFQPGYLGFGLTEFNKRLRRRDKKKNKEEKEKEESKESSEEKSGKKEDGEECITISDDEEVRVSQREPSRFAAQESMSDNKVVSKYRSIRSYFGKDEACYIMDAKVQGNIGRYLNHSCSPNVFVQNVFVDTHDPRFPWVSFFALHHIRAGTELTWNYNYDVGSVPGKVLYCYCGAPNCRGRLL